MASDKKPSAAGIVIGIVLIISSFVVGIGGFVGGGVQMVSAFDGMVSLNEGTTATVQLQAKEYWVYGTTSAWGGGDVTIIDPDGNEVAITTPTIDSTYSSGSTTYSGVGEFTAPVAGEYEITVDEGFGSSSTRSRSSSSGDVLLGPPLDSLFGTFAVWAGVGSVAAALLFIVGMIVLIMSILRRSRWRKNNMPTGGFGGPYGSPGGYPPQPPGGPGAYPQQPPAPGGYQQPPAPGGYQPPPAPGGYQPPPAPGGYQPPAPGGVQPPPPPGGTGSF
ncbi:MAG: PPC domain-containing protein [Acidimicrobiales bacterium]|nr:PPC domain-containing protein [Acidimicrobiales bacterium]